ncbi:MAG: hypothetical protein ACREAU_00765 [Nitrosopumilaceae archaeon]
MALLITSFFTSGGSPATGLTPTIRIWEVISTDQTLVIGAPEGTSDPGPPGGGPFIGPGAGFDGAMIEMFDKTPSVPGSGGLPIAGSVDGFYKYTFDTFNGYVPTSTYVVRTDGGITLPASERFQTIAIIPNILDEPRLSHSLLGSVGEAVNLDRADITAIRVTDLPAILSLLDLVRKFETNRTKIDIVAKTLTVFNDDCTTILRVFSLLDSTATPSTTSICERKPVAGGTDGFAICP